jgi:nicotinate-nucleotide pyrophosphorylase (carboxylating)
VNSPTLLAQTIERLVRAALDEDLAAGDLTTEACISAQAQASARGVARQDLVLAGVAVAETTFHIVDPTLRFHASLEDGTLAKAGSRLWTVQGSARSILMAERVALNFAQRMSGIATLTRRYVDELPAGSTTRITDTRKTTPGLRVLERYAVRAGGGRNHRDSLGTAVLIKDNHIIAAGGIGAAIARAKDRAPHTSKIECEVDSLAGLLEAIAARADIVMLDNMNDAQVREAIEVAADRVSIEVSGGITLPRIAILGGMGSAGKSGVGAISVGALTHSAPAVDIALDFDE